MVAKRRPARTIHKPSGEASGITQQAAEDDAVDGQWQSELTITRDKAKNPRFSGRAKGPTAGADAAGQGVKPRGSSPSDKALRTGAANRKGSPSAKKARKVSARGKSSARRPARKAKSSR